jgi:hypothetical protein
MAISSPQKVMNDRQGYSEPETPLVMLVRIHTAFQKKFPKKAVKTRCSTTICVIMMPVKTHFVYCCLDAARGRPSRHSP